MPKKSNKTAHVLSLITNGPAEPEGIVNQTTQEPVSPPPVSISTDEGKTEASTPVIVEIQGDLEHDFISDLVKKELEQELKHQEKKEPSPQNAMEFTSDKTEALGADTEVLEEDSINVEDVKSQKFILEEFDEEDNTHMIEEVNVVDNYEPTPADDTKVLHNLAEELMKIKAPDIMKTFSMCTCQSCVYDVMALALNHVTPLYTVTDKGLLFQKLSSYELQYGTDLTSAITRACIKVKLNPNHVMPVSTNTK